MNDSKFNKYKSVSEILNKAMKEVIKLCHEKNGLNHICNFSDNFLRDETSKMFKKLEKGIMMPTCISKNKYVSHCNNYEDDRIFDGDILRIEMACHIDFNVVNLGETIKVGEENWKSDLYNVSKLALKLGILNIEPNMSIFEYKKLIEKIAKNYNLHLLKRPNVYHDEDTEIYFDWCFRDWRRFNEPSWVVKHEHELELDEEYLDEDEVDKNEYFKIGEAYHLIIAFTRSERKAIESDKRACLYQNTKNRTYLKVKSSRDLISDVNNNYNGVFFKLEDLSIDLTKAKIGIRECLDKGVIRKLGIVELNDEVVILKTTIIIQRNSVYNLGLEINPIDVKLSDEFQIINSYDKKFDLR